MDRTRGQRCFSRPTAPMLRPLTCRWMGCTPSALRQPRLEGDGGGGGGGGGGARAAAVAAASCGGGDARRTLSSRASAAMRHLCRRRRLRRDCRRRLAAPLVCGPRVTAAPATPRGTVWRVTSRSRWRWLRVHLQLIVDVGRRRAKKKRPAMGLPTGGAKLRSRLASKAGFARSAAVSRHRRAALAPRGRSCRGRAAGRCRD